MGERCPSAAESLFVDLLSPWGDTPVPSSVTWPSDVGDDNTPFEFSVAIGGARPELRILVEAQADSPTPAAYWDAGLALAERMALGHGAVLTQLRKIEDLFLPDKPENLFSVWLAVCLFKNAPPAWKIYLNPQAHGREHAPAVVEEALTRLGYPAAWRGLSRVAGQRGAELDEVKYFALDLSAKPDARVKVYFRHHEVRASELDRAFSGAASHVNGDAEEFCRAMLGDTGPFVEKPVGSCFAFVGGDVDTPSAATLYLPVNHYVDSDALVRDRLTAYLAEHRLPVDAYRGPLKAFSNRPLDAGVGMHSYASLRRERGARRVTVYFAPEVFRVDPPAISHRRVKGRPIGHPG